ncbi:MAG: peptidoglycan editing factor PgeF [Gammaproteobacteria bacterium]|nr:peptidoglycan editing factor PgeF [Gammaproteobacteria bacterium]
MIKASWQAPVHIHGITTTRRDGNIALHVNDDPAVVFANRQLLSKHLPNEPLWLEQVHSTIIIAADQPHQVVPIADAVITSQRHQVIGVMTADCLPLLICDKAGQQVAAVHAGWRGLAAGIIEQAIAQFFAPNDQLMVWLGPAIGASAFEVGQEVLDQFVKQRPQDITHFKRHGDKYLADLYGLARARLAAMGITNISGGDSCTYTQTDQFYSYRRDGQTGRMVSLIWIS